MAKRKGGRKRPERRKGTISIHPYSGQVMGIKKEPKKDIEVEMEEMLEEMFREMDESFRERFGCQCPEFHWGCTQCKVWDIFERFKKDLSMEYMR